MVYKKGMVYAIITPTASLLLLYEGDCNMITKVNSTNYKEVVENSNVPVLLDFSAEWCPHCQALLPVLNGLSEKLAGKVAFVAIDTDESPELAQARSIEYIPALFVYNQGKYSDMLIAPKTEGEVEDFLKKNGAL